MSTRVHTKSSAEILDFLTRSKKDFQVERTSSGFSTFLYKGKSMYVRDKVMHRGSLNKILLFHREVAKSDLFKFLMNDTIKEIEKESSEIERSLVYKGFVFNPVQEKSFKKVIKIDFGTAYWQTCRCFDVITSPTYREIIKKCIKTTRLKITGTLGKKTIVTDYVKGKKVKSYFKEENKRRKIFGNIYNRIRKFVDELMMYCWKQNPDNFIGYYVDCIWIKEFDADLIDNLKKLYKLSIELVDLDVIVNNHNKIIIHEIGEEDETIYDVQLKTNEFVTYKKFYNFTTDLSDFNLKTKWEQKN
jgi:hypothetical protein